jgi:CRP/FNR family cyclic AMP-dependent transcriptional regulator
VKRASATSSVVRVDRALPRVGLARGGQRYTTAAGSRVSVDKTGDAGVDIPKLRTVPLLSSLTDDQLALVSHSVEHRRYRAERPILFAEESADGLYVILQGEVKVLIEDAQGRELVLYILGAGEIFGEVALFDGQPHSARFDALTSCEILFIPAAVFSKHVSRNADVLQLLLRVMAHRRRYAHHTIHRLAFMNVYDRVVATLIQASAGAHGEWFAGPGCQEIAQTVGATPEMVNRVIRAMIERGIVRRHSRKLLIKDRASLCQLCADINGGCRTFAASCLHGA